MRPENIVPVPSAFGQMGVVWTNVDGGAQVQAVLLPNDVRPRMPQGSCATIDDLCAQVVRSLRGEAVAYDLTMLAWELCAPFQQRVLRAEYAVPRGSVSTYGRVARHLGSPLAARAVGRALATNPFPIIIPCHRAVRTDGSLGGYRGGVAMKRALLELEGVAFGPAGKVSMERVYY